jgi:hypothetical protein
MGELYAVGFDDVDNLPDPANRDSNARDSYTRIVPCDHFTEDGEQ